MGGGSRERVVSQRAKLSGDRRLVEAIRADEVDVLPEQRRKVLPGVLGNRITTSVQLRGAWAMVYNLPRALRRTLQHMGFDITTLDR